MREASSDWFGGRDDNGALRILAIGSGKAQKLGVDAAANVERAKLADPAGHRAIARDHVATTARPSGRCGTSSTKTAPRHFRDRRVVDREDAERAGAAVEGGEFAKKRTRFHV